MPKKFTLWNGMQEQPPAGAEQAGVAPLPPSTGQTEIDPQSAPATTAPNFDITVPKYEPPAGESPLRGGLMEVYNQALGPEPPEPPPPQYQYPEVPPEGIKEALKQFALGMIPGYRRVRAYHQQAEAQDIAIRNAEKLRMYEQEIRKRGQELQDRRYIAFNLANLAHDQMTVAYKIQADQFKNELATSNFQLRLEKARADANKEYIRIEKQNDYLEQWAIPNLRKDPRYANDPARLEEEITRLRMAVLGPNIYKAFHGRSVDDRMEGLYGFYGQYFPDMTDEQKAKAFKFYIPPESASGASGLTTAWGAGSEEEPGNLYLVNKGAGTAKPVMGPGNKPLVKPKAPEKIPAQTKSKIDQAYVIKNMADKISADLQDPDLRAQLGPWIGRLGQFEIWYGDAPLSEKEKFGKVMRLFTDLKSFSAMQPALHGFRGMNSQQHFEEAIGTLDRNPDLLLQSIQGIVDTADSFIVMGQQMGYEPIKKGAGAAPAAAPKVGDIVPDPENPGKKIKILKIEGGKITEVEDVP